MGQLGGQRLPLGQQPGSFLPEPSPLGSIGEDTEQKQQPCRWVGGGSWEGKARQNEPSFLSLNEIKTGTFLTTSEEGRLAFQKAFKEKAGSETRNRGRKGRGTSKPDIFKG